MIVAIQTTIVGQISVWLVHRQNIVSYSHIPSKWPGSDQALAGIDQVLQKNKISVHDIQKLVVVRGPGSFTAVRTGLIIANTLGALLQIPLVGIVADHTLSDEEVIRIGLKTSKKNTLIRPWYGKSPNITKAKPKKFQARAKR